MYKIAYHNILSGLPSLAEATAQPRGAGGLPCFLSPLLFKALVVGADPKIKDDPFKSDVFSLGMCLVYAVSMGKMSGKIYDWQRGEISIEALDAEIEKIRESEYSEDFIEVLEGMLEIEESLRFSLPSLVTRLEKLINPNEISAENVKHSKIYKVRPSTLPPQKIKIFAKPDENTIPGRIPLRKSKIFA